MRIKGKMGDHHEAVPSTETHPTSAEPAHEEHGHVPHYSDIERRLYKRPPGIQNKCTDFSIAYESCVREYAPNPVAYVFGLWWADRWLCAHESHAFQQCELERAQDVFKRNHDLIKAHRRET